MNEAKETLQQAQTRHIKVIEAWGKEQRKIAGVPVVQMLNYDLVQVINQIYLQEFLGSEQETKND